MAVGSAKENVAAAQLWLTNAEKAYNSDEKVFADMNLLLAESEIRHLRTKGKKNNRKILSKMSFCIIIIVVLFFGMDSKMFAPAVERTVANTFSENAPEQAVVNIVNEGKKNSPEGKILPIVIASEATGSEANNHNEAFSLPKKVVVKEEEVVKHDQKAETVSKNDASKVQELSRVAEKALRGL